MRISTPVYVRYGEATQDQQPHKTQTQLIEQLMISTRDQNGQFLYTKENRLQQAVENTFTEHLHNIPQEMVQEIIQRSCAPAWAVTFIIKRYKNSMCNDVKNGDILSYKANCSGFVNALMVCMRAYNLIHGNNSGMETR